LFRLTTAEDIQQRVDFHNTGKDQLPGVIAMSINDGAGLTDLDENLDAVLVVVNASNVTQAIKVPGSAGMELHSIQQNSVDTVVQRAIVDAGEVRVPGLSVAVFVLPQQENRTTGIPVIEKDLTQMPALGKENIYLMGTLTSWDDLDTSNQFKFVGNQTYRIELVLEKGFYKVKAGNKSGLEFGKLGAFLKPGTSTALAKQDNVMNLQLAENGEYRFSLNFTDKNAPLLTVEKID
jgi:hypothetical protein